MQIIPITHEKKCPVDHIKFVGETSAEAAAEAYTKHYGVVPAVVYVQKMPSGRCNVCIPKQKKNDSNEESEEKGD